MDWTVVPKNLWKCTPITVKATARLRLLGEKQSMDILDAVASRLGEKYEFYLGLGEDVTAMNGKDEGVFA
jgi:guanosine-diphosphatase